MHPRISLLLALAIVPGAFAGSWLTGPSAYRQAVEALGAARWSEAERLIEAADPTEGRVDWVKRLLKERRDAELSSRVRISATLGSPAAYNPDAAVNHSYAYHNLYLFVRAEGLPDALQQDAFHRAQGTYQGWIGRLSGISESLRWAYAGLLHEGDRAAEADAFLTSTTVPGAWDVGVDGPDASEVNRFGAGYQMILAYFHTARGDADRALAFLAAARKRDAAQVDGWVQESDDFWRLREKPAFQKMFPTYRR